jgi:hypothetical protein
MSVNTVFVPYITLRHELSIDLRLCMGTFLLFGVVLVFSSLFVDGQGGLRCHLQRVTYVGLLCFLQKVKLVQRLGLRQKRTLLDLLHRLTQLDRLQRGTQLDRLQRFYNFHILF